MALRAEPTPGRITMSLFAIASGSLVTTLETPTCASAARTERVLPAP